MRILLTGGTGLLGKALCRYWFTQNHELYVWSRRPESVAALCGTKVRGLSQLEEISHVPIDAVINLAGAPIATRRWTSARKQHLVDSRIGITNQLISWLRTLEHRPKVLISGSAVGWYGNAGDQIVTENSPVITHDFASELCNAWERSALQAEKLDMRVVLLRTGLVLNPQGGLLKQMQLPFRLGLGPRLGSGHQWMPWIHWQDHVAIVDFLLHNTCSSGPYNACSPAPVTNKTFTQNLAHCLGKPTFLTAPASLLQFALGEMAEMLLGGQRAIPQKLSEAGFTFQFTDLNSALKDLLN